LTDLENDCEFIGMHLKARQVAYESSCTRHRMDLTRALLELQAAE